MLAPGQGSPARGGAPAVCFAPRRDSGAGAQNPDILPGCNRHPSLASSHSQPTGMQPGRLSS
eukprot:5421467-Pleurochrysis_carterae.AAC.3